MKKTVFATAALTLLGVLAGLILAFGTLLQAEPTAALDSEEQAFLTLINNYRAANGAGPLSLNTQLNNAARWLADDMAAKSYLSHTDSLGREAGVRLLAFGFTYGTWAENIAAGQTSAQAAFDAWKNSPVHNTNMLNPIYNVIGIARAYNASATYGWYWATDFGYVPGLPVATATPAGPTPTAPPGPGWAQTAVKGWNNILWLGSDSVIVGSALAALQLPAGTSAVALWQFIASSQSWLRNLYIPGVDPNIQIAAVNSGDTFWALVR